MSVQLKAAKKTHTITSFKDPALATSLPVIDLVDAIKPGPYPAMHFIGNVLIEIEGDTAFSESYFQAFRIFERDGRRFNRVRAGRYVDRFERRDEKWKIIERVLADDWNRVDEVVEMQVGWEQFRPGSKDSDDPVFGIRGGRLAREPRRRACCVAKAAFGWSIFRDSRQRHKKEQPLLFDKKNLIPMETIGSATASSLQKHLTKVR